MKELIITLPYPPSINRAWRISKQGGLYLIEKVKRYRQEVAALVFGKTKFENKKLFVSMGMFPPDNRKRDIDNIAKCAIDSLQHANVFNDDSQIYKLYIEKHEKIDCGKLELTIREIL